MRNAMRDKHKMCRVKIPIREIGADVLGLPTSNVLLGEALQLRIVSLYRAACFTSGPPTGACKNERSRVDDDSTDSTHSRRLDSRIRLTRVDSTQGFDSSGFF